MTENTVTETLQNEVQIKKKKKTKTKNKTQNKYTQIEQK